MNELQQLKELREKIHQVAVVKGFWDKERNFGELLMLVTSELSEALEAHRTNKLANIKAYCNDIKEASQFDEDIASKDAFKEHIKDTVEDEIADAIIRLLDLATGLDIDIEWHILAKIEFNKTREHKHGKSY